MDPSMNYPAAFVNHLTAAVALHCGVFFLPLEDARGFPSVSYAYVRDQSGYFFERAICTPEDAFTRLVDTLRPLLPTRSTGDAWLLGRGVRGKAEEGVC